MVEPSTTNKISRRDSYYHSGCCDPPKENKQNVQKLGRLQNSSQNCRLSCGIDIFGTDKDNKIKRETGHSDSDGLCSMSCFGMIITKAEPSKTIAITAEAEAGKNQENDRRHMPSAAAQNESMRHNSTTDAAGTAALSAEVLFDNVITFADPDAVDVLRGFAEDYDVYGRVVTVHDGVAHGYPLSHWLEFIDQVDIDPQRISASALINNNDDVNKESPQNDCNSSSSNTDDYSTRPWDYDREDAIQPPLHFMVVRRKEDMSVRWIQMCVHFSGEPKLEASDSTCCSNNSDADDGGGIFNQIWYLRDMTDTMRCLIMSRMTLEYGYLSVESDGYPHCEYLTASPAAPDPGHPETISVMVDLLDKAVSSQAFSIIQLTNYGTLDSAFPRNFLGWSELEWVDRSILGLVHKDDIGLVCGALANCLRDSRPRRIKPRMRINDRIVATAAKHMSKENCNDDNNSENVYELCDVTLLLPEAEGRPVMVARLVDRSALDLDRLKTRDVVMNVASKNKSETKPKKRQSPETTKTAAVEPSLASKELADDDATRNHPISLVNSNSTSSTISTQREATLKDILQKSINDDHGDHNHRSDSIRSALSSRDSNASSCCKTTKSGSSSSYKSMAFSDHRKLSSPGSTASAHGSVISESTLCFALSESFLADEKFEIDENHLHQLSDNVGYT
ncbi:hypothetical protein H4219_003262 [Mycoemilia scoparia]|uniref:Uncharacterized protein n=1 Tax=Mycoemilia scoparia TaxID=417184 RepID=A0A9W8DT87_9FUNG|nr:hypothetical protein H4219_003262 [Mycoemilia scoparia]